MAGVEGVLDMDVEFVVPVGSAPEEMTVGALLIGGLMVVVVCVVVVVVGVVGVGVLAAGYKDVVVVVCKLLLKAII